MTVLSLLIALPTLLITAAFWYGTYRVARAIRRAITQTTSDGRQVPRTASARFGVGNLAADATLVAQIGKNSVPRAGLNGQILRPTIGIRVMSIAMSLFALWLVWADPGAFLPDNVFLLLPCTALILYGTVHTNTSFLRFDADGFEVMDSLFRRRMILWDDLEQIRDNGHYLYIFDVRNGRSAKSLKYLAGMPHFLSFAFDVMDLQQEGNQLV